jgi:hypothetical protein
MDELRAVSDQAAPRLSLAEAAIRLGKSVDAVRAMIRRGKLQVIRGNDGRLLVTVPPSLVLETDEADDQSRLGEVEALSRLQAELDEAKAEIDHWRQAAHEAELKQVRAEGERDTAQAAARSDAEAKDALLTELKAMLADARRPWLARVLSAIRR